jgi:hypothetical protein
MLTFLLCCSAAVGAASRSTARETLIPAGTVLHVRLDNSVGSDTSRVEDTVRGHLTSAVIVNGRTVVPAGSAVLGSVTQSMRSGKVKGRARLGLRFYTLAPTGDREGYRIATRTWSAVAPGTKNKDAATIGLPAAGGAIIGGIVGGKKGAAIGAAAGGGAGTAVVLTTHGKEVHLSRGSVLPIRLTEPVIVRG